MLILGERHLRKVPAEYTRHYNGHRPHQALQQESLQRQPRQTTDFTARIERRQILNGLITEYRTAAQRTRNARSAPMSKFWHSTRRIPLPGHLPQGRPQPGLPTQAARHTLESAHRNAH